MASAPAHQTCFVVLSLARTESSGGTELRIDVDSLYRRIEGVVVAAGLGRVRADFVEHSGFVEPSMLERLLIADLVIVDQTAANPEVMYMIGVRQGVNSRPTILIRARGRSGRVSNWPGISDVVPYVVGEDGTVDPAFDTEFEEVLAERLRQAIGGDLSQGVPLLDATGWGLRARLEHDKTDVFLERIAASTEIGGRIRAALGLSDRAASIDELHELERDLVHDPDNIPDLDTGLLGVYLGYRERAAYQHMVDLYPRLPPELKSTPVATEQLALALNRLAEDIDQDPTGVSAQKLRTSALASLDALDSGAVTAETLAIRGRIYKGWFHAATVAGDDVTARDKLAMAIESYERAIRVDMRDYFPGINAITLRLRRGTPGDVDAVARLVPVVRMAVDNAPAARSEQERYWQIATKLELACAVRDWDAAADYVESAARLDVDSWMHETTIDNLGMYRTMFARDAVALAQLDDVVRRLER